MVRQSPVAPMTRTRRTAPPPAGAERQATAQDQQDQVSSEAVPAPPSTAVHAQLGPIIRSKIQPPVLRDSTLTRPRLIESLLGSTQRRLTLLIAEAGYGKTTLMADFAVQTGVRTVWFRLDATDADFVTWANHIIAAIREFEPTFGQATLDLMAHLASGGPPRSAFVSSVIGELGRLDPVRTVLVLDDFHLVDRSEEAKDFVGRLSREAPPWLAIVVSTRRRPHLELGRLAASGDVAELQTEDLRFSIEETSELFADGYRTPLDEDVLHTLDDKVNGWAASLQLFHGSVRGRPAGEVRALVKALSGASKPIYDFLAEEVLANVSDELERFLMRSSLLDQIGIDVVLPLFGDDPTTSPEKVGAWIDEADRLMLMSRSRGSSELRHLHPLLRDFLDKLLRQREGEAAIRSMHLGVAQAVEESQPLVAAHHYIEAGDDASAMRCLGSSVMLMMGSGQWGEASDLIDRIHGVPKDPAVAAIEARRLIEEGSIARAAEVLDGIATYDAGPDVRAAVRHARMSISWRTGDSTEMSAILAEIEADPETPALYRHIAELFVDTYTTNPNPVALSTVGRRLLAMSQTFEESGHLFYAAVALHNAAVAFLDAGEYRSCIDTALTALSAFDSVPFLASEQMSTKCVLSLAYRELGDADGAISNAREALATGREFADVPAELSFVSYVMGDREGADELLVRARLLVSQGQSDIMGEALVDTASAIGQLDTAPDQAIRRLEMPLEAPLDFSCSLSRRGVLAQALLARGSKRQAIRELEDALPAAKARGAARVHARLELLQAVAAEDGRAVKRAIAQAARSGELALLEVAPTLSRTLHLLDQLPDTLAASIEKHPQRWLPMLRRMLEAGNTPSARAAASALDTFGTIDDVGLLRAYAKTYGRRGPARLLGRKLARKVSPVLHVHDLGRVDLAVGDRRVLLAKMRRKPASVLMFLVTKPAFTANREEVIDELWRDADPGGAINNLNQSLYFLRRDIDPWFEDDVSVDYVHFQGDLVWLDPELVRADSQEFLATAQRRSDHPLDRLIGLVRDYRAAFAPEFEYDEWAIGWRTRLHSTFLDVANTVIERAVAGADLGVARDVAAHVLEVEPTATDVERQLVWLYAQLGLLSAAKSQYAHLRSIEEADGLQTPTFGTLIDGPLREPD